MKIFKRILIFFTLVLLAGCHRESRVPEQLPEALQKCDSVVEKLLVQYQVEPKSVATRIVKARDGGFVRTERRIPVSAEFNALDFNRSLSQSVAEFGAAAIATEKTEERSVTMHIKKDGIIVQSLVFIVKKKTEKGE